eukprot:2575512-Amphidinium_carterae.1
MVWAQPGLRGDPVDAASRFDHLDMAAAKHPRFVAALTQEHLRQLGAANMAACASSPPQLAVAPIKAPGAQAPVIEQGHVVKLNLTVDPSREGV